MSAEVSLEEVIPEQAFADLLRAEGEAFFRLTNTLVRHRSENWTKRHYYQLLIDSDELESFLDDFGAGDNETYHVLRELVASVRWFALSGFNLTHLWGRLDSYHVAEIMPEEEAQQAREALELAKGFLTRAVEALLWAVREEARSVGAEPTAETFPEQNLALARPRLRLPRNVGEEVLVDEQQKVAEVASKFLAASEVLEGVSIRKVADPLERRSFLGNICSEAQARVYEATVHNLQSTYDTYIAHTGLEKGDDRLRRLRGCTSASLHMLASVTYLTHFVERHGGGRQSVAAEERIASLVSRDRVEDLILNVLLYWANQFMQRGRALALELLPAYTNVQELQVGLPEQFKLHARPASLIVGIVNHYGTPVEMEIEGESCNAASILELLVTIGSHPEARQFTFRGDENPLRDIGRLFEHGLGERGMGALPEGLEYLRRG